MYMKKNKLQIAIIIVLLLIITVSVSYAFYGARVNKTNGNAQANLTTKYLKLDFVDGPQIDLVDAVPGQKVIKTFTVTNTGNQTQYYNINLKDVINNFERTEDLVYTLTSDNSGATVAESEFPDMNVTLAQNVSIATNTTQTYTLTVEYKNLAQSQNVDMNKTVSATIQINDVNTVMMINSNSISYTNAANPNVHTVADALDDLTARLGN